MARSGSVVLPPIQPVEARLGKLLQFERRRREGAEPAVSAGPARVILFTGVRYERTTPLTDAPSDPGGPTRTDSQKRSRG